LTRGHTIAMKEGKSRNIKAMGVKGDAVKGKLGGLVSLENYLERRKKLEKLGYEVVVFK